MEEEEEEDALPLSVADLYRDDANDANDARPPRRARRGRRAVSGVRATLVDLADSELARVAHVNACLDGEEHLEERGNGDVGSRGGVVPGDGDGAGKGATLASARRGTRAARASGTIWRRGRTPWTNRSSPRQRLRAKLTFAALDLLGDADLRTMGIDTLGARKRILAAIAARRETEPAGSAGMARTVGTVGTMGTRASPSPKDDGREPGAGVGLAPTRSAETVAPVFARAKAGADLRDSPPRPPGTPRGDDGDGRDGDDGVDGVDGDDSREIVPGTFGDAAFGDGTRAFVRPSRSGPASPPALDPRPRHSFHRGRFSRVRQVALRLVSPLVSHALHADHYKGLTKSTPGPDLRGMVFSANRRALPRETGRAARAAPRGGCR